MSDLVWRSPSPRLWRARCAVTGLVSVLVVAAAGLGPALAGAPLAGGIAALACAVVALAVLGVLRGRYRSWGYAEREEDLLVRRGVLVRRLSVVPYGRMQYVDVTAGVVDRVFGLSTVQLHTASAHSDARIPGLEAGESERLRDKLAALGESQAAGL